MYFLVMDIQFTLFKIQPEIVQTELLLLVVHRGALMAQPHADSGQQLLGAKGLSHVVVRSLVQGAYFLPLLSPGGNHDNGHIGLLADLAQHLHAVDIRQSQIQQNQVRMIRVKEGYAGQSVISQYISVTPCLQGYLHKILYALVILNDKDRCLIHPSCPPLALILQIQLPPGGC